MRRPPRFTLLKHSFPTRRVSDLLAGRRMVGMLAMLHRFRHRLVGRRGGRCSSLAKTAGAAVIAAPPRVAVTSAAASRGRNLDMAGSFGRSEEHTSELQSLMRISYAVFCLKKKRKNKNCNE